MINCFGCGVDWLGDYGHTAEDFANGREGDPVYSVSDGIVLWRGVGPVAYGNVLIVQYNVRGTSIFALYAHLRDLYVVPGQIVGRRQQIATVGQSGTFMPHLHFEIRTQPLINDRGYTFYPFSGVSIDAYGMTFYSPTWYIDNHRNISPSYLIADASNPTGVYFVEGNIKRGVPAEVYNSWGFARYPIDYISHDSFVSYTTAADLTKLVSVDGRAYFIDRGEKKWIPDANLFNIWGFDWNAITPISGGTRDILHSGPNLSFLAQMEGSGTVYLVDNKTRHPLLSPDLLQHFGYPAQRDVSVVSNDFPLSTGSSIDSFTIKGSGTAKYVMSEGHKKLIPNDAILNLWNLGSSTFTELADSTIGNIYSGADLANLGQTYGEAGAYYLEDGTKRAIVNYDTLTNWGFDQNSIFKVGPAISNAFPGGLPLTRLIGYSGSVYLAESGKKRLITNYASMDAETLWLYGFVPDDVKNASATTFALMGPGDNASMISSNLVVRGDRVYFIDAGAKRAIRDTATFDQWGFSWSNVIFPFNNSGIDSYPQGDDLTLLAANAGKVYMVQNNTFRHIFDADTFNIFKDNWGLGWGDIKPVSDSVLASKSPGAEITFPKLVTYSGGGMVYYMDSDGKRPIQNAPTFDHWGFQWSDIFFTRNNAFLASYPSPNPLSVLASNNGVVYLISNGEKHPIDSAQSFNNHASFDPVYNWNNIFPVSSEALSTLGPDGDTIY